VTVFWVLSRVLDVSHVLLASSCPCMSNVVIDRCSPNFHFRPCPERRII
jgi:hypothetical protein